MSSACLSGIRASGIIRGPVIRGATSIVGTEKDTRTRKTSPSPLSIRLLDKVLANRMLDSSSQVPEALQSFILSHLKRSSNCLKVDLWA